jgi:hypothetical protein
MWSDLVMAMASSMVPGFGLLANIVDYITSDDPNSSAGTRFIAELVTTNLPGGFLTSLATNIAIDILLGSQLSTAIDEVTPYNEIVLLCNGCRASTHYYARKSSRILCSRCLTAEVGNTVHHKDKVFVLKNGVYQLHSELKVANELYGRNLRSKTLLENSLQGRTLKGRRLS